MAKRDKQKESDEAIGPEAVAAPTGTFSQLYPRLYWHLTSRTWGDGKTKREPGGLSLFQQDGAVKVCLRERNMGQVAFLTAASVDELLAKVEGLLRDGGMDWREDKYAQKQPPRG